MRCTMTGEPYTVYGYGGKQVRDNIHSADLVAAFAAFHAQPARRRRLQHRRRPREQLLDARGDRALRADRRQELDWELGDEARIGRPPLVDQRPRPSSGATIPTGRSPTTSRRSCSEIHDQNAERWTAGGVKYSVVIPAQNEAESIASTVAGLVDALERRGDRLRGDRRRRCEHRRDARRSSTRSARRTRASAATPRTTRPASASPSAPGFDVFTGDAVAIVMADGSDSPARRRPLPPGARGGLRLRVRLALRPRRARRRLPAVEARS